MAQADYNIANQSGSAFRSELNETLSAILSLNSGSAAPTTTAAYSLWADTTTGLLKIRDSSNSAFVTIGTMGSVNLGLAALASPTFTGVPLAPTASAGTNTTQIATTAFVAASFLPLAGGTVTGNVTLNAQSDIRFADADSSNYIAIQAPATITANVTLTLPAADGTNGQVLSTNGSGTLSFDSRSRLISGTSVASTSGTSIDFTSIPSWVKRVTVMFNNVSLSGSSHIQVQIGSGSVTTTGYSSIGGVAGGPGTAAGIASTTGFIGYGAAPDILFMASCVITLLTATTYTAAMSGGLNQAGANFYSFASGGSSPALSGALDRVRITTLNGTDTFDAGTINILYEG